MIYTGTIKSGSGKASKAFQWGDNHRIDEIENALGERVVPGTLNVILDARFDFENHACNNALIDDGKLIDGSEFKPHTCYFYKCKLLKQLDVWVIKFDGGEQKYTKGAKYSIVTNKIEIISKYNLRDFFNLHNGDVVTLEVYDE